MCVFKLVYIISRMIRINCVSSSIDCIGDDIAVSHNVP